MLQIRLCDDTDRSHWDQYVYGHPESSHYHLFDWGRVILESYRHQPYYLMAVTNGDHKERIPEAASTETVCGVLPLIHMKSRIFGNRLVSMPFLDLGGPITDDPQIRTLLLESALKLAREKKADHVELRMSQPLAEDSFEDHSGNGTPMPGIHCRKDKVRMLLDLPGTSEELFQSFKSKLKSQIRRPAKDGFAAELGGAEFLNDFYAVFTSNMRDLGSPVHSKKFITRVASLFSRDALFCLVKKDGRTPAAAGLLLHFKDSVYNPWASSLRRFTRSSPNMLLYWKMLESACDDGCRIFDFGRSSVDGGTFRFKKQWGAQPRTLSWCRLTLDGHPDSNQQPEGQGLSWATAVWKRLPTGVTTRIGPMVRKNISL